jgi:hypothetical protein
VSKRCWPATLQVVALLFSSAGAGAEVPAAETRKEVSIWSLEAMDVDPRKYEIEGPFAIGDPVHETLTLKALVRGGAVLGTVGRRSAQVAQFMRGVFWNDDPCAQLFSESISNPLRPSLGLAWFFDFRLASSENSGNFSKLDCPLLGESHFGRLQFLHAMANSDDIAAEVTQEEVLAWISVTYRIATGRLDARQPLSADPVAAKLLGDVAALSAMRLFRDATPSETRQRALGSLLHLVQDSFALGHVERQDLGPIVQFLSYRNQNSKKHAHDDAWQQGETDEARILATPGAAEAIDACAKIVAMYVKNASWSEVESHLRQGPFRLGSPTHPSGPGKFR